MALLRCAVPQDCTIALAAFVARPHALDMRFNTFLDPDVDPIDPAELVWPPAGAAPLCCALHGTEPVKYIEAHLPGAVPYRVVCTRCDYVCTGYTPEEAIADWDDLQFDLANPELPESTIV